jgi:hypothetical protein
MRAITNRIRRLEFRLAPQVDMEEYNLAVIVHERRRIRLEREGVPANKLPGPLEVPPGGGRYLSAGETLALCLAERRARQSEPRVVNLNWLPISRL